MSLNPTRREVLIGAAAVATTAAMPGAAIAEMSLVEQAEFAAIRFPLWGMRDMVSALSVLEHCAREAGCHQRSTAMRFTALRHAFSLAGRCPLTPGACGLPKPGGASMSWSAAKTGEDSRSDSKSRLRWRRAGKRAFVDGCQ